MREWLKGLDQIDIDCIHQYEYLLDRKLNGYEEYHEIDQQVDEMVLEWESRKEFFKAYPNLERYKIHPNQKNDSLESKIKSAREISQGVSSDYKSHTKEVTR